MTNYYDPSRQDNPLEHNECCLEDGEIWFGHGMICRYPELHPDLVEKRERDKVQVIELTVERFGDANF